MLDLKQFWNLAGNRGEGIRVAMLDTGIDSSHPEFRRIEVIQTDLCSKGDGVDLDGHGTQCSGIISRVAPACTILSGRILMQSGSFTTDALLGGLFWASRNGADIICVCTGDRSPDPDIQSVIEGFYANGTIMAAAVGNNGASLGAGLFPARYSNVLAVGSAEENGQLAAFTELTVDKEVVCLPGIEFNVPIPGGLYKEVAGTSMSTAVMAGLIALSKAQAPDRSPQDVWQKVLDSSEPRRSPRGNYRLLDAERFLSPAC